MEKVEIKRIRCSPRNRMKQNLRWSSEARLRADEEPPCESVAGKASGEGSVSELTTESTKYEQKLKKAKNRRRCRWEEKSAVRGHKVKAF